MAWKEADTCIKVDLDEFDVEQILQHLINIDYLTTKEATMILDRMDIDYEEDDDDEVDYGEVSIAWEYATRGDRKEALVHIERALGNEWIGRLA